MPAKKSTASHVVKKISSIAASSTASCKTARRRWHPGLSPPRGLRAACPGRADDALAWRARGQGRSGRSAFGEHPSLRLLRLGELAHLRARRSQVCPETKRCARAGARLRPGARARGSACSGSAQTKMSMGCTLSPAAHTAGRCEQPSCNSSGRTARGACCGSSFARAPPQRRPPGAYSTAPSGEAATAPQCASPC